MPRKPTNGKVPTPQPENAAEIAGLFGDTADTVNFDWNGVDADTFLKLARAVAECRGLLSLGGARTGSGVYISLRLGDASKSFVAPTSEAFNTLLASVTPAWQLKARKLAEQQKE